MAPETPKHSNEDPFSGPDFFTQPESDQEGYDERRLAAGFAKNLYEEAQLDETTSEEDLQRYRSLYRLMQDEADRFGVAEGILPQPAEGAEEP